ncbi:hypothetical protein NW756_009468 [Fusarium oxysporum]|nr:hypothetical protein NW763_012894 [Fusarium oxysporum]KAJ4045004.1 hypothetical protein NW753_009647 [Fusarium oxysporum]KAJ4083273.1 hypothetical protein NW756_009468 [Fusarium oxysporum]KAJ4102578.1 hypothetical protein NW769_010202 [Fusarium oxysporum]KAJ4223799.1 hypothetical protein NW760_010417 [Fusarium oxysporum]
MAFAHGATLQLVARVQLEELIAFKAQYPEQDVWPPYIHDLEAVRPHLELVAIGGVVFNEEAINARVNKGFFAAEYDLEELRATSPSATAPNRKVYGPVTAAAGTTDEFRVDGQSDNAEEDA